MYIRHIKPSIDQHNKHPRYKNSRPELQFCALNQIACTCSIVWSTIRTLTAHYMELNPGVLQTIIANDFHFEMTILKWHWCLFNLSIHLRLDFWYVNNWFLANRTCYASLWVLKKALSMHTVTASHNSRWYDRVLHIA